MVLLITTLIVLGSGLRDASFRHKVLHPERLPVAVLILATGAVLWLEMRRSRHPEGALEPGEGIRSTESSTAAVTTADAIAATAVALALIACAFLQPASLGDIADPATPPALAKAPWFLVGLQELCVYFDPWFSYGALPILLVTGLLGLPFLETESAPSQARRALFLFGWLFLWLWPMAVGAFLRGPGWQLYGLLEPWSAPRPATPDALTLAQVVWVQGFHVLEPVRWWIRELPGMLILVGYFALLPMLLMRWKLTRGLFAGYRDALGSRRFYGATAWVLATMIVPLKMYGRWLWGIGYWVHLPEWSFNF